MVASLLCGTEHELPVGFGLRGFRVSRFAEGEAHSLKGSSSFIAARYLPKLAKQLEEAARDKNTERVPYLVGQILHQFNLLQKDVASRLKAPEAEAGSPTKGADDATNGVLALARLQACASRLAYLSGGTSTSGGGGGSTGGPAVSLRFGRSEACGATHALGALSRVSYSAPGGSEGNEALPIGPTLPRTECSIAAIGGGRLRRVGQAVRGGGAVRAGGAAL